MFDEMGSSGRPCMDDLSLYEMSLESSGSDFGESVMSSAGSESVGVAC